MEKKTVGSGLTKKIVLTYSHKEWGPKAREDASFLGAALRTYPECLLAWKAWAADVLVSAKLNTVRNDEEEDTLEWYASQILRLVNQEIARLHPPKRRVRTHSERARRTAQDHRVADLVSRGDACQLGYLVTQVRWKFQHEKAALLGHVRKDSWRPMQAAGAQSQRERGQQTTRQIKQHLDDAVRNLSKSFLERPISVIIRRIQDHSRKLTPHFSYSTYHRHLTKILGRR